MIYRLSRALCILMFVFIVAGCASEPEPSDSKLVSAAEQRKETIADLDHTAERFFKFVEQNKPEQALAELNVLNRLIPKQNYDGITTVQGLEALTRTISEANGTFVAAAYDPKEAMLSAAKVRLAVDSLNRERRPMWMEFEKTFAQDVKQLKSAVQAGDWSKVEQLLAETTVHYEMIRPALIISGKTVETEAIDSLTDAMSSAIQAKATDESLRLMEYYAVITSELFKSDTTTFALPANRNDTFIWTLAIGAIVVSVLSYVAWRRFLYEKNNVVSIQHQHQRMEP